MLGLCTEVDPNMNPIHTVGPYLQRFVFGKDDDAKGQVASAVREMAMSVIAIPDRTNRLFERANRGDVQFQIAGLRESALLLYAAVHQVLFALLAIGFAALGSSLSGRSDAMPSVVAWTVAGMLVVALFVSIVRARKLVRRLESRRSKG